MNNKTIMNNKTSNMKRIIFHSVAVIFLVSVSMSCSKKSSSAASSSGCKIVSAALSGTTGTGSIDFSYNDDGKIASIVSSLSTGTTTKSFTYTGNVVMVSTTTSGSSAVTTDSIVVNSDGLMLSDISRSATDVSFLIYNYSGTEVTSETTTDNTNSVVTVNFTFTNGDFDKLPQSNEVFAYNDKASEQGDYFQFGQMASIGVPWIQCAHQAVSISVGATTESITYTYDSSGKITQMVLFGGGQTATYTYTYQCD
jgi:YD repeat-containing protein